MKFYLTKGDIKVDTYRPFQKSRQSVKPNYTTEKSGIVLTEEPPCG